MALIIICKNFEKLNHRATDSYRMHWKSLEA